MRKLDVLCVSEHIGRLVSYGQELIQFGKGFAPRHIDACGTCLREQCRTVHLCLFRRRTIAGVSDVLAVFCLWCMNLDFDVFVIGK